MDGLSAHDLPDDPDALKSLVLAERQIRRAQAQELRLLHLKIAKFEEERRRDRAKRFGASSEAGDHQYRLFDEAELQAESADDVDPAADDSVEVGAHRKRRPKRRPLPADLPRVAVHHDLSEAEKRCACGCEMKAIGEQVSEQLDVIPAQVYVLEHHRPTYSCPACDESIVTAPMPPQPIPKSTASPGLLAHVAVAKYADGLPLYRQSKQFSRLGVELPRNTLASHMVKAGTLIEPLLTRLEAHIVGYDVIGMDETPVQVLKEPGKPVQSQSYMWVMKGGPPHQPAILYHYAPTRAQSVPEALLGRFQGYLQTDGYGGYNATLARADIIGVGCWAHVRRKFMDAKKALPKDGKGRSTKIHQALSWIGQLYQLERELQDVSAETRQQRRVAQAVPILEKFKAWLDKQSVPPKMLLGKAIGYALQQWPRLVVYVQDGRLSIDNNPVENAIRPFALGRKAWLFSDSQDGARASAALYSLIETAKANGLNDYAYLKYVFTELPTAGDDDAIDALLPWLVDRDAVDAQLNRPN